MKTGDKVLISPSKREAVVRAVRGDKLRITYADGSNVEVPLSHASLAPVATAGPKKLESVDFPPPLALRKRERSELPSSEAFDIVTIDSLERAPLALCVVAKSQKELDGWLCQHGSDGQLQDVELLIAINNVGGKAGGYAAVAERARRFAIESLGTKVNAVFGVTHADTAYRGHALATFRDTAAAGACVGMVGRPLSGHYVWSKQGGTTEASCLDGCAIFFRLDSGLVFDPVTFDGFHCAGEDVALSARNRGIPLVVPAADADHASTSNFVPGEKPGNPAWLKDYGRYLERLQKKYPNLQYLVS